MIFKAPTRGLRNCNPGNIRKGTTWRGMAKEQSDTDFVVFMTPLYGLRALAKVLRTYAEKHKLVTVTAIISRWAPGNENDTDAYIDAVCQRMGVRAHETVDLRNDITLIKLMQAIVWHENGQQPYPASLFAEAVALANQPADYNPATPPAIQDGNFPQT